MKRLVVILAVITLSAAMAQTRWQYGRLSVYGGSAGWSTTEFGIVRGDTYEEFYTAMTGAAAPVTQDPHVVILDLLGSWGWELVAKDGSVYIFKRRIP